MATVFKTFLNNDIKSTRTLLHEAIPLTGALVSGTYGTFPNGGNIKNYAHGMFQSVYDYPYLSSSANHIYDLTVGISNDSALSASTTVQQAKKINMYNQMAAVLMGYDSSGNVIKFDRDGDLAGTTTDKIDDAIFINFARLLQKDEIKKGSFSLKLGAHSVYSAPMTSILTITDAGANTSYKVNSAAGEYGILSCSLGGAYSGSANSGSVGLVFYQAGIAVLSSSVFQGVGVENGVLGSDAVYLSDAASTTLTGALTGTSISGCADSLRHRIYDMSFNNTTELNSTIHFCRLNNTDFNYSANPSYLSQSKIRVKNNQLDAPVSYMTTVGLYSADNELLAVAKVSEPLKKDPTNEMIVRVRLDY
jgi:hypothetical protein